MLTTLSKTPYRSRNSFKNSIFSNLQILHGYFYGCPMTQNGFLCHKEGPHKVWVKGKKNNIFFRFWLKIALLYKRSDDFCLYVCKNNLEALFLHTLQNLLIGGKRAFGHDNKRSWNIFFFSNKLSFCHQIHQPCNRNAIPTGFTTIPEPCSNRVDEPSASASTSMNMNPSLSVFHMKKKLRLLLTSILHTRPILPQSVRPESRARISSRAVGAIGKKRIGSYLWSLFHPPHRRPIQFPAARKEERSWAREKKISPNGTFEGRLNVCHPLSTKDNACVDSGAAATPWRVG